MNNAMLTRIIIAVSLLIAVFAGMLYMHHINGMYRPIDMPKIKIIATPLQLGAWSGEDTPPDELMTQKVAAEDQINRAYSNPSGKKITFHGAVFGTFWRIIPHTPIRCYRNSGWSKSNLKDVELKAPGKPPVKVQVVTFKKEHSQIMVMFWFQFDDLMIFDTPELHDARDKYRDQDKWPAIIKVLLQTDASDSDQAEQDLIEFGSLVYAKTSRMQHGETLPDGVSVTPHTSPSMPLEEQGKTE